MLRAFVTLATIAASAQAAVVIRPGALPRGWVAAPLPPTAAAQEVKFSVALREQHLDEVKRIALAVSDPQSPEYGNHRSAAELAELTAPNPADSATVRGWLEASACTVMAEHSTDRLLAVRCTVAAASDLLATSFRTLTNSATGQSVTKAADISLPEAVDAATAALFGLHGLPLPPRPRRAATPAQSVWNNAAAAQGPPPQAANVTPAVIAEVYNVGGVTVDRSSKNKQAVAEFQGQTYNSTDLDKFFSLYVPDAKPGDEKVHKSIGDPGDGASQDEASLDIQFIMGVAPGVKTDFYLYSAMDFCADLKNWTSAILSEGDDAALVHSVSYGLQANLTSPSVSGMGCSIKQIDAVDADFAKLAAQGISIIFASGDSGSGYTPSFCTAEIQNNTKLTGTEVDPEAPLCQGRPCPTETIGPSDCCEISSNAKVPGFTWTPPKHQTTPPVPTLTNISPFVSLCRCLSVAVLHIYSPEQVCTGTPGTKGEALLGPVVSASADPKMTASQCCALSGNTGVAWTVFSGTMAPYPAGLSKCPDGNVCCLVFGEAETKITNATAAAAVSGTNKAKIPGKCSLLSKVDGHSAEDGAVSGGSMYESVPPIFPSWPAVSPWVTAVGATRFVNEPTASGEQMATDQFGSGGGFSSFIKRDPEASYQDKAVEKYLSTVSKAAPFPPAEAFDPEGKGSPDVAALGEGFQVVLGGEVVGIGGTSASTPMFAGLISLINEARIAKGGKPMG